MRRIIIAMLLCLLFANAGAQIPKIDVFKSIKTTKNMDLSELANKLSYTRLSDAGQTALISRITYISANKSFVAIYDRPVKKLFLFDAEGIFIRTLMNQGKGPNEFIDINSIDLNDKNELLVLLNWNQINILNSDGSASGKFSVNGNAPLAKWITDNIIAIIYYFPFYLRNNGYEVTFIDRKGKILNNAMPNSVKNMDFNDFMPKYSCGWNRDTLYYWNEYHDNVYSITKDMQVIPRIKLFNNAQRYSVELLKKGAKMEDGFNTNTYYILDSYHESGNFAFISGVYKQCHTCLVVNRTTGIGNNIFENYGNDHYIGLMNDLDGGYDFWPGNVTRTGDLIMTVDPNDLRETFTKHLKTNRPIKFPSQQDSLRKQVIDQITLMDNPILIKIEK